MKISWTPYAWEEYLYWQQNDKNIFKCINLLIKEIAQNPFVGKGKPEALQFDVTNKWSRRIDLEHRLVYENLKKEILIFQCRFHYE